MLNTAASCRKFLETEDPSTIAQQIQQDQRLCRESKLPSLLTLYLPPPGSKLADAISQELFPETPQSERVIRKAQYAGTITVIKAYLHDMIPESKRENSPNLIKDYRAKTPSNEDFQSALNVLDFCLKSHDSGSIALSTRLDEVIPILQQYTTRPVQVDATRNQDVQVKIPISGTRFKKNCYICQFRLLVPHSQYPSLCKQCGDFNLASSALSLPGNLLLHGRTALVTGARLNLGYHSALRLLRCGARVIVTTRYPRDAESRYMAESDARDWEDRLRIVGADFRAASDVFHLVNVVKECLNGWNEEGKLDILINNAAQTLTDSLEKEDQAVTKEEKLGVNCSYNNRQLLLDDSGYKARIRGGVTTGSKALVAEPRQKLFLKDEEGSNEQAMKEGKEEESNQLSTQQPSGSKSSWVQSLHQIPYEDIISAHSVNTFVPLILIREFLPIMGRRRQYQTQTQPTSTSSSKPEAKPEAKPKHKNASSTVPAAYIVNISSREGIFENSPSSRSKDGHHVHTNLTKAALNMLTETEAGPAWRERKVAMNTVDPGYMSAAPEIESIWRERKDTNEGEGKTERGADGEQNGAGNHGVGSRGGARDVVSECPIGWEDGAGRVLWPLAVGESGKGAVWGRFLKHFGGVEVDVGIGR